MLLRDFLILGLLAAVVSQETRTADNALNNWADKAAENTQDARGARKIAESWVESAVSTLNDDDGSTCSCSECVGAATSLRLQYWGPAGSESEYQLRVLTHSPSKERRRQVVTVGEGYVTSLENGVFSIPSASSGVSLGKFILVCLFESNPTQDDSCQGAKAVTKILTTCETDLLGAQHAMTDREEKDIAYVEVLGGCSQGGNGLAACESVAVVTVVEDAATPPAEDHSDHATEAAPQIVLPEQDDLESGSVSSGTSQQENMYMYPSGYVPATCAVVEGNCPIGTTNIGSLASCMAPESLVDGIQTENSYLQGTLPICSLELCCIPRGRCDPYACGPYALPIGDSSTLCQSQFCEFEECCVQQAFCTGQCAMGFVPINVGRACADSSACTQAECCAELPTCGDLYCPAGTTMARPIDFPCVGSQCSVQECCKPIHFCLPFGCPSGFSTTQASEPCGFLAFVAHPYEGGITSQEEQAQGNELLLTYGQQQSCMLEECCSPVHHCGDYDCGHDSVRIVSPDFTCHGPWSYEECCAPLYRCQASGCPSDHVAVNVGHVCIGVLFNEPNPMNYGMESGSLQDGGEYQESQVLESYYGVLGGYRVPQQCVLEECCRPKDRCGMYDCPADWVPIRDPNYMCSTGYYDQNECCAPTPRCSGECPYGYVPVNTGMRCGQLTGYTLYTMPSACKVSECCEKVPMCGDQGCGIDSVRIVPPDHVCQGFSCRYEECCAPLHRCGESQCPFGWADKASAYGRVCGPTYGSMNLGVLDPYHYSSQTYVMEYGDILSTSSEPGRRRAMTQAEEDDFESSALGTLAGYVVPEPCLVEECCYALPRCGDYACPYGGVRIAPRDHICSSGTYRVEECCASLPMCDGSPCPSGMVGDQFIGRICTGYGFDPEWQYVNDPELCADHYGTVVGYQPPAGCAVEECCRPTDHCGDFACPLDHVPIQPPAYVCPNGHYDVNICCAQIPRCSGFCPSGYTSINQGMACGSYKDQGYLQQYGDQVTYATRTTTTTSLPVTVTEMATTFATMGLGLDDIDTEAGYVGPVYARPVPCLLEECCEKTPMCGDQGCGFDNVRIQPEDYVCRGFSCDFHECCAPLHRCGEHPCPLGFVPRPDTAGAVCGPTYGSMYPTTTYTTQAPQTPPPLMTTTTTTTALAPTTPPTGLDDGMGFENGDFENLGFLGELHNYATPEECTVAECCLALPLCGDYVCPVGTYLSMPPEKPCSSMVYDPRECCAPLPVCTGNECSPGTRPIQEALGRPCTAFLVANTGYGDGYTTPEPTPPVTTTFASGLDQESGAFEYYWLPNAPMCHEAECCTPLAYCGVYPCENWGMGQVAPSNHICAGYQCQPEECCRSYDAYQRYVDYGRYEVIPPGYFCRDLGCSDITTGQECEHASVLIGLPDNTATAATSVDNPFGCYFRPNYQSLWFNEFGTSPSQTSRNSICYCTNSVNFNAYGFENGVLEYTEEVVPLLQTTETP